MDELGWKYILKYCIIGDAGVGKSCLLLRFTDDKFDKNTMTTLGVEFGCRIISVNDKERVKVQCWDTAGSEQFRSITRSYFRGAAGCLLVYSVGNRRSFENLDMWLDDIRRNADENLTVLVVANKTDIDMNQREVSVEEGEKWSEQRELQFLEVSAKSGQDVDQAFDKSAKAILAKLNHGAFKPRGSSSTSQGVLSLDQFTNKTSGCC
ncbi:hypothetical protein E3P98_02380 [Wallemia ichthyophaga]|nr:hypothetical protein E3P98_02380 [Wallemia ichthyophaga]